MTYDVWSKDIFPWVNMRPKLRICLYGVLFCYDCFFILDKQSTRKCVHTYLMRLIFFHGHFKHDPLDVGLDGPKKTCKQTKEEKQSWISVLFCRIIFVFYIWWTELTNVHACKSVCNASLVCMWLVPMFE